MNKWRILIVSVVVILLFVLVSAVYADSNHIVRSGDTLWSISRIYGTTPTAIQGANPGKIPNLNLIYVGDVLLIPTGGGPAGGAEGTYVVRYGDTLSGIAWRFGTTVSWLQANNGIADPNWIYVGQVLRLPANVTGNPTGNPEPVVEVPGGRAHVVRPGDNLFRIALRNGTSVERLQQLNGIVNPHLILVGERITLP